MRGVVGDEHGIVLYTGTTWQPGLGPTQPVTIDGIPVEAEKT